MINLSFVELLDFLDLMVCLAEPLGGGAVDFKVLGDGLGHRLHGAELASLLSRVQTCADAGDQRRAVGTALGAAGGGDDGQLEHVRQDLTPHQALPAAAGDDDALGVDGLAVADQVIDLAQRERHALHDGAGEMALAHHAADAGEAAGGLGVEQRAALAAQIGQEDQPVAAAGDGGGQIAQLVEAVAVEQRVPQPLQGARRGQGAAEGHVTAGEVAINLNPFASSAACTPVAGATGSLSR